jgi:hypothetical protein
MRIVSWRVVLGLLALLPALPACDAVDQARGRFARDDAGPAPGSGVALGLQTPGMLRAGEEGIIRLSITNRSDSVVSGLSLELVVPAWSDPLPPRPGDREVAMIALPEGGTRFSYRLVDEPIEARGSISVEQRIRVPVAAGDGRVQWNRTVRARLLSPQGQPLAEVEGELALEGAESAQGEEAAGERPDRLGPVRLGMTADAARRSAAETRDTSWTQEGMTEQGVWVPIPDGGRALAVLSQDSVSRLEVRERMPRTPQGPGVGSTMGEMRAAWGNACAEVAEGRVVVWFPGAPGMSFALDMRVPENAARLRENPREIPDSARVTRWWLRRGVDSC